MSKRTVRIICAVLAILLVGSIIFAGLSGVLAVNQSDIDALENQKNDIAAKKDELSGQISNLESEMATVNDKKKALDEQNELTRQEIELINEQIDMYEQMVKEKAAELEAAIILEEEQKEDLRIRMRTMEESADTSYISILFQSSSFTDLLSRLDSLKTIMERDKNIEDEYIAARENVQTVKAEYESILAEQKVKKIELEDKKVQLEAEIAAASQMIIDLEADIEEFKAQQNAADAQMSALGGQIASMIAALEAKQEAEGGDVVVGTGTYSWPLPGIWPSNNSFGNRFHPIFHEWRYHSGTDIGASTGTPILAADSGTIVSASVQGGYGNCVIINHSGGRSTLYAHLNSYAVSTGQSVTKGQVIGYVGSTGWSTGPHLHFEVRVNGVATDPMSYFGR